MTYFLGMDGGGSKTIAVVADAEGDVLGVGRSGGINFQEIGVRAARAELALAHRRALRVAGVRPAATAAAGYGICGADRDKDYATVMDMIIGFDASPLRVLVNDTSIALRAGTPDGVGVACISGTGVNVMGFNREGRFKRVGGLGPLSADWGGGTDIAVAAVNAAMKQAEGRGPNTLLHDLILERFGLDDIEDMIELGFCDVGREDAIAAVTPLAFRAAAMGDAVAHDILVRAGSSIGKAARFVINDLFAPGEPVTVALGGSVFMRGRPPVPADALARVVKTARNPVKIIKLRTEPAVGGVLLAMDGHYGRTTPKAVAERIACTLNEHIRTPT
ncbi:MAG: ATPase [Deltaproteobacteria bacterium]|nr:ATPase [Deltaproteobacteria bacterium]